jgi:hypothetical protein
MNKHILQHELWENTDGTTLVCISGPDGDGARATLHPRARLAWVFDACSHLEAMHLCHERMEWPPYAINQPDDSLPYPLDAVVRQKAAIAAMRGDREVIATSACARAWQVAAQDLKIRVESPFSVIWNGTTYWCSAWIQEFGAPAGTLIAGRYAHDDVYEALDHLDFFTSGLNPYYYDIYDRDLYVRALNDWGWFGDPHAAPAWFNGELRGHGKTGAT